jgi:rod shape-determining protein MreD
MIMQRGQQLLLPVRPWFMWGSLLLALLVNMMLTMGLIGRLVWMPDFLALVLVFWTVQQPLRVGVGIAFWLGLVCDVHQGTLLGQHALAYTMLSFLAIGVHRRLQWFSVWSQVAQVFPLFLASLLLMLAIRLFLGGQFPGGSIFFAPVLEAMLWPVVSLLLLLPQKRPPDTDANRPL